MQIFENRLPIIPVVLSLALFCGCITSKRQVAGPDEGDPWRALHVLNYNSDEDLAVLEKNVPELARMGVNVLILEVDYHFDFVSHPELRQGENPISKEAARSLARTCRQHDIRLVPQFQCLGHQSWEAVTFPLLTQYPQFDLTPGAFPNNEGIYCREWDPTNPQVNEIVFALMDELIDAFEADAIHVGMDEVFLLGSEESPSTRGKDPAELFANAVNDYYKHLVESRGVEMLMWGDRLIDGTRYDYGRWEASMNGTAPAVDRIPTDIIICDWHYGKRESYPSLDMFTEKGFRVLPSGWNDTEATQALMLYARQIEHPGVLGHLFTTWDARKEQLTSYPALVEGMKILLAESVQGSE